MTTLERTTMPGRRTAVRTLLAALAAVVSLIIVSPAPHASASTLGTTAVSVAAAQKGKPYRYGAAGPSAFDCSGLVKYVFSTRRTTACRAPRRTRSGQHPRREEPGAPR